jgi:hypothetical protein
MRGGSLKLARSIIGGCKEKYSDVDMDTVGSIYFWLSWIRIQIRILYTDPDPAALKLITI